jgi:GTPase
VNEERQNAVIVGVQLPGVSDVEFESGLSELERLVTTLGYRPLARITQQRPRLEPAAALGQGKLEELAALTGGSGNPGRTSPPRPKRAPASVPVRRGVEKPSGDPEATEPETPVALVAVDHDLSPSQARNLERATGVTVLDRAGVIIEIFHRHAKSREARLQVEMARLAYTAPRVRESPSGKEKRAGRGAGEAAIELDRRRIRDRLAELREQLAAVQREQGVRREQRKQARRVALVGYTNAGKSSLMRALTGSSVLVEDKLFATLDTTVRALVPETQPRILVSDTVGFIRKLPHDLVASFKSTLDEALEASLLLVVVDAADPAWESQLGVTQEVLREIGAGELPVRIVMNKIDRLTPELLAERRSALENAWFVSARSEQDVARVHDGIVSFFESSYASAELVVPYASQRLVAELHEAGRVDAERYEEDGVHVVVRTDPATLARIRSKLTP